MEKECLIMGEDLEDRLSDSFQLVEKIELDCLPYEIWKCVYVGSDYERDMKQVQSMGMMIEENKDYFRIL